MRSMHIKFIEIALEGQKASLNIKITHRIQAIQG